MAREADPIEALRAFVKRCGGQKAASVELGCSRQFVGQMFSGKCQIPDSVLGKLGLRRTVIAAK